VNRSIPKTFVECRDVETGKAQNLVICKFFPSAEAVRMHIERLHRRLEYRSHEPWDDLKHGKRVISPVPAKYVLFDPPAENKGVLITRKPFPRNPVLRQSILKGA
jgi:hypothetical protein